MGIIASTAVTHTSGVATGSHSSTFRVGAIVAATSGRCPASTACPAREVGNHRNGDFTAEFASGQDVGTGLLRCVSRVENGSWGHPMSYTGRYVSLLAAGMEGREGRERICYDLSSCGGRAPPGGKWQLIWGGGSAARISNGTGPQNPGGGGETWLIASREQPNPRVMVEPSEEVEVAVVVADVAQGWMDFTGSTLPDSFIAVAKESVI